MGEDGKQKVSNEGWEGFVRAYRVQWDSMV